MIETRVYIADMVGAGTIEDSRRCVFNDLISFDTQGGENLHNYEHPLRNKCLALVIADTAKLNTAELDSRVRLLINATGLESTYNGPTAILENNGINLEWLLATHSWRQVIRHICRVITIAQLLDNQPAAARFILTVGLDTTVGGLTATQRNAAKTWMTSRGMATAWITNSTTIRQVLHAITTDLGYIPATFKLGPESFD